MEEIENLVVAAFIKNIGTVEFTNMADFLTEIFIKFTETLDQKRFKVAVDLCIPGIISVYKNWFTNSYDYSIEELSSLLTDFILNGIQKKSN